MANNKKITATRNYCGIKEEVKKLIKQLRAILYPNIFGVADASGVTQAALEMNARQTLEEILPFFTDEQTPSAALIDEFLESLSEIHRILDTDIVAAYQGDPAAQSHDEVMLAYPSFEALTIFRLAHKFYQMEVPILPRMMTEYAHSVTGIDIHPGATIGRYFFIDHGTGVVIGETAVIGDHVKIYQGVTIGAKSFKTDEEGKIIKGTKRHPNIGNHVVIYANATILGGETTIGDHCVIGGSVWLTESVDSNTSVITKSTAVSKRKLH